MLIAAMIKSVDIVIIIANPSMRLRIECNLALIDLSISVVLWELGETEPKSITALYSLC